ncbi:MAG: hypothetical protein WKF35_12425 [Ferruginibacter sp.]
MNINRNNYETYLLLYIDNELSVPERNEVELFLQNNPDLFSEMEILQKAILPAEESIFIPKTLLYKNATDVESVEESLLLHLDDELSQKDAYTVESQIQSDPQVNAEWDLLQKTKLSSKEIIVFREKHLLYRQSARVLPLRWLRIAAAILIGAAIFTSVKLYNSGPDNDTVSRTSTSPVTKPGESLKGLPGNNNSTGKTGSDNTLAVKDKEPNLIPENNKNAVNNRKNILDNQLSVTTVRSEKNKVVGNLITQQNVLNKDVRNNVEKAGESNLANQKEVNKQPALINNSSDDPVNDEEIKTVRNSFAKLAVNEENNSGDRILYMDEDKVSRSKIGGLFRRVKRVVERNTKIKTSNGLRIGGFEIAVK